MREGGRALDQAKASPRPRCSGPSPSPWEPHGPGGQPSPELRQPIHRCQGQGLNCLEPKAHPPRGCWESEPVGVSPGLRFSGAGVDSGFFWREGPSGARREGHRVRNPCRMWIQNNLFKNVQFTGALSRHCHRRKGPHCPGKELWGKCGNKAGWCAPPFSVGESQCG